MGDVVSTEAPIQHVMPWTPRRNGTKFPGPEPAPTTRAKHPCRKEKTIPAARRVEPTARGYAARDPDADAVGRFVPFEPGALDGAIRTVSGQTLTRKHPACSMAERHAVVRDRWPRPAGRRVRPPQEAAAKRPAEVCVAEQYLNAHAAESDSHRKPDAEEGFYPSLHRVRAPCAHVWKRVCRRDRICPSLNKKYSIKPTRPGTQTPSAITRHIGGSAGGRRFSTTRHHSRTKMPPRFDPRRLRPDSRLPIGELPQFGRRRLLPSLVSRLGRSLGPAKCYHQVTFR